MEFYYAQYITSNHQYPDLGAIIEFESAQTSSSQPPTQKSNKWMYLVGALATVGLASFSFLTNANHLEQASHEIKQDIYLDYISLTKN